MESAVALVRGACLGLAEALDLLGEPASVVLRDALDLPAAEALRELGENPDYMATLVRQAVSGRVDPQVLLGVAPSVRPPSQRELVALRSRRSTSGASTERRR